MQIPPEAPPLKAKPPEGTIYWYIGDAGSYSNIPEGTHW